MKQTDRHLVIGLLFLALLAGFGVGRRDPFTRITDWRVMASGEFGMRK
jgi:hypothetical protein